jgi:hypothetical protein
MKTTLCSKRLISLLIITAMIISSASIAIPKAHAVTPTILVVPAVIDDPLIAPGATITVNASAADITDLFTWQVQIEYDPAILNCTGVTLPPSLFNFDIDVLPIIDNVAGTAAIGSSKLSAPGASGSDVLATFQFEVVGRGVSGINYSRPLGVDTFLLDSTLTDIIVSIEDGSFNNYVPPAAANIYIAPHNVIDPTLIAATTFDINLTIADATGVNMWTANLFYANAIISATNVVEGTFLNSMGTTTFAFTIDNAYNATHGRIDISCSLGTGGASGAGNMATVTFTVVALGESEIAIANVDLRDPSSMSLPFTTTDGYFNNMLIATLAVDPPEVSGPSYLPGTTFKVNVTLGGVDGLKTCIFNFTYDPSILQELNINFQIVQGQIPVKAVTLDDAAGYIWTSLTYNDGLTIMDPLPIMNIEFVVLAMGVSPLNLTDTHLYDMADQPITHEVHHGIFIGLIRDVAVMSVSPDLNIVYQSWIVYVNVTVKNKGNVTETFDVQLFYESNAGPTLTVTGLAPEEERTVTIPWDTTLVPYCHNYSLSVTAGPVPYEFNLADNTLAEGYVKVRIMGDENGDGVVDMRDISDVCNAYAAFTGSPKWNFYADFNRDGRIDLRDIGTACANFGKRCP